jgi:hypothetical protein
LLSVRIPTAEELFGTLKFNIAKDEFKRYTILIADFKVKKISRKREKPNS